MDQPTIIDVWAPWCRSCRAIEPIVDQAGSRLSGRVAVERVNADEQPGRVRELKVLAVPTLIAFRGEREVARLTGAQSEQAINDLFARADGVHLTGGMPISRTDRTVRVVAAAALIVVGLVSGAVAPLLAAGAAVAVTALPRRPRRGSQ